MTGLRRKLDLALKGQVVLEAIREKDSEAISYVRGKLGLDRKYPYGWFVKEEC